METTADGIDTVDWTADSTYNEVAKMSTEDIRARIRLINNEVRILRTEILHASHTLTTQRQKIEENNAKIKVNKVLPYLVASVIELLDVEPQGGEEDEGANVDQDALRKGKCAVIRTTTRQTYFLPIIGLVDATELSPGDLVGVNKDSYLVLEKLPVEYDSRVKAMEVDEKPSESYNDIGGLDMRWNEIANSFFEFIARIFDI